MAYRNTTPSETPDDFGGTANITFARSTSNPLVGIASGLMTKSAANRQGEGFYYQFTPDSYFQAKVLRIKVLKEFTANYVDGDMRVYVVGSNDSFVADFQLFEVTARDIDASSNELITEFQTSPDALDYRLCFHIATTSALAYDLKVDNVIVGPRSEATGTIMTDWEDTTVSWFGS